MDLISKKELLQTTGISYGQLYRWKREGLLPEEWFIKQSSYTGQETYFPREQMLSRVEAILEKKSDHSLEEVKKMLSPEQAGAVLPEKSLEHIEEIDGSLLPLIRQACRREQYSFWDVVLFIMLSRAKKGLNLSALDLGDLLEKAVGTSDMLTSTQVSCTLFSCEGRYHLAFSRDTMPILFDAAVKARAVYPLADIADGVNVRYSTLFTREETAHA